MRNEVEALVGKGCLGGGGQSQGNPGEVLGPIVSPVPGWILGGLAFQVVFGQSSFSCPGVV